MPRVKQNQNRMVRVYTSKNKIRILNKKTDELLDTQWIQHNALILRILDTPLDSNIVQSRVHRDKYHFLNVATTHLHTFISYAQDREDHDPKNNDRGPQYKVR